MNKEERNTRIIELHNEGQSINSISLAIGMSKGGVHKVISSVIVPQDNDPIKPTVKGGKLISSFVGWTRITVNQYVNKETAEVISVKFNKAVKSDKYGTFITV